MDSLVTSTDSARPDVDAEQVFLASLLRELRSDIEYLDAFFQRQRASAGIDEPFFDSDGWSELATRHLLIAAAAGRALDVSPERLAQATSAVLITYTFPLTCLDRVLDGQRVLTPFDESLSLTASSTGFSWLTPENDAAKLVRLLASSCVQTITAMKRDEARRNAMTSPNSEGIEDYWSSDSSRLNGSNIASLMIGMCSLVATGGVARGMARFGQSVGRMRQVADEILDAQEDAESGLVTLPLLYALTDSAVAEAAARFVASPDRRHGSGSSLPGLLTRSRAAREIQSRSDRILASALSGLGDLCPRPEYLAALIVQRRMQIDRGIAAGFRDLNGLSVRELTSLDVDVDWRTWLESDRLAEDDSSTR